MGTVTAAESARPARPDAVSVAAPQTRERQLAPPEARPADPFARLTRLQQGIGNQAVQARLQPKLVVGPSGDRYEQEADRVADQIVRDASAPAPTVEPLPPARPSVAQRDCVGCDDDEAVQRKPLTADPAAHPEPAAPEPTIARGAGRPLPGVTRTDFERRFGHDFGDVRLHTDGQAAESARAVRAHAYTVGRDIAFAAGQYAPETSAGRHLLAHELTHVVQQSGGAAAARPAPATSQATADTLVPPSVTSVSEPRIQRDDEPVTTPGQPPVPAERPLSRPQEIEQSRTSVGAIAGTLHPPVITLYNFAIDSADLKPQHLAVLKELADLLRLAHGGNTRVLIIGHTDNSGPTWVNNPLSNSRALAVKRILAPTGIGTIAGGAGAYMPFADNATVDGRSRNRRVDIHVIPERIPPPPPPPPPPVKEEEPTKEDEPKKKVDPPPVKDDEPRKKVDPPPVKGEEPTKEDEPRKKVDLPACGILCGIIGVPIVGILACIKNPAACLAITGGGGGSGGGSGDKPPGDDDKPPRDQPPTPHACVDSVSLPSGTYRARAWTVGGGVYHLTYPFTMRIRFRDDPVNGCFANMGEYQQEIWGFSERDDGIGVMRREAIQVVGGNLHPTTPREDARGGMPNMPYGHRYWDDATELIPRPNQQEDSFLDDSEVFDDREHGPRYKGGDEPSMESDTPREHLHFRFGFHGGPVERFLGVRRPIGTWSTWIVEGDFTLPPPVPPPPPAQPPPQPPPPPSQTTPPSSAPPDEVYDARLQPTSPAIGRGGRSTGRARTTNDPREREA